MALRSQRKAPETDIAPIEGTFPAKRTGYCPVGTSTGDLRSACQGRKCGENYLRMVFSSGLEDGRVEERKRSGHLSGALKRDRVKLIVSGGCEDIHIRVIT